MTAKLPEVRQPEVIDLSELQTDTPGSPADLKARFTSRKFLLAVGAAILILANTLLKLGLTAEQMNQMLAGPVAYIFIEGIIDIVRA